MADYKNISPELLSALRDKVDTLRQTPIFEILLREGKDIRQVRAGKSVLYHSPFREDNTPSFHVDEENHRFSDPGDMDPSHKKPGNKQAGGDTIDLVMWLKGISYNEALVYLWEMNPTVYVSESTERKVETKATSTALAGYTLHSGGAKGADTAWGEEGAKFGVKPNHYYHGRKTPTGNMEISEEQYLEGVEHVRKANLSLHRNIASAPQYLMDLLARNWMQVKNADAVYAVSTLDPKGSLVYQNGTGYIPVAGGTGWAVQMAIDEKKPVFLFDQSRKQWLVFTGPDSTKFGWTPLTDAPVLRQNFAGIGSRELTEDGRKAIVDSYHATIKALLDKGVDGSSKDIPGEKLNVSDKTKENSILSVMARRPFSIAGMRFHSVEHWMQYQKAVFCGDLKLAQEILACESPYEARLLGKQIKSDKLEGWAEQEKTLAESGIRMSFISNSQALDELFRTGKAVICSMDEGEYPEALMKVRALFQSQRIDGDGEYKGESDVEIKSIAKGISSNILKDYETQSRMIDPLVLDRYCSQVNYTVEFMKDGERRKMTFAAVGFPNRSGEWTLRGAPYKTASGKTKEGVKRSTGNDVTIVNKKGEFLTGAENAASSENVVVFEGFNDFLSWLSWKRQETPEYSDVLILNSTVNIDRGLDYIAAHKKVYTYMDADQTGEQATAKIKAFCEEHSLPFEDCSRIYASKGKNDFNELWVAVARQRIAEGKDIRIRPLVSSGPMSSMSPVRQEGPSAGLSGKGKGYR